MCAMNAPHVVNHEADNLLRARDALANSGVKIADFFLIHAENGKPLASGDLPSEFAHGLDRFEMSPLLVRSSATEASSARTGTAKKRSMRSGRFFEIPPKRSL